MTFKIKETGKEVCMFLRLYNGNLNPDFLHDIEDYRGTEITEKELNDKISFWEDAVRDANNGVVPENEVLVPLTQKEIEDGYKYIFTVNGDTNFYHVM